ncbi:kinesin-like protein KIF28P isoform X2 [Mizuhopecten yessoensis]|uniref:kinesin-like protein KIF28P isoform X2 n=1 Tax=Mizuhopecten yessoensis TaxID=6573 RepID=UPI000B4574C7|nr:kinesin-like protein KIF28P isoform X2 [Mizuhopecten yessoensis]
MAESVKVAVRVRPFNSREIARNAKVIIGMSGKTTTIQDPENMSTDPRPFAFDFSYWSHDEFKENSDGYLEPTGSKYADQTKVFDDLGRGVLDNAWKGYNCSLFAYGQTGSGKSYSMVGYGSNKGIVPIFCDELFKAVEEKRANAGADEEYQVTLGMLEIYNEQVRDLLNPKTINQKGGLKVRQDPKKGFYVEQLTSCSVNNYKEIDNKINDGTRNRTVASTSMNATSSRAHTIVAITFTQKTPNETGQSMTRTAIVNLVDLAGSERADSTGATGDRLKEGSAINQSLSSLGNVIKALADQSTGKKKVVVPYRDSVLTKLLQNALGGNSKTIMIAALSPADINYEETLSTLRFADRAKAIKTTATVNESPTDRLIRELREENARLMDMLKQGGLSPEQAAALIAGGGGGGGNSSNSANQEIEEMKKQLEEQVRKNQEEMENMKKTWKERAAESQVANSANMEEDNKRLANRKVVPHLWNLNEDPALTAMVVHFVNEGTSKLGNKKASPPADITLSGLSILPAHAVVTSKNGNISIKPLEKAKILVNGQRIIKDTPLHHNDRLLFGANNMYVFHHPQDEAKNLKEGKKTETPTFDSAHEEIAQKAGLMNTEGKSAEDMILQEEVVQMLQLVNEANAMSEELDKKVKFEVALISPQARGIKDGRTVVMVKMASQVNSNEWMWDKNKAINRKSLMQQIYQDFVSGEDNWDVPKEQDPFWEPADQEILVGTAHLHLMSLAHALDIEETLAITDYKGTEMGHMCVYAKPCTKDYQDLAEDDFVDEPNDQIGKNFYFILKIDNCRGLPQNIAKSRCKYKYYTDDKFTETNEMESMNPNFNFEKKYKQTPVTEQYITYLNNGSIVIEVWGRQKSDSQEGATSKGAAKPAAKQNANNTAQKKTDTKTSANDNKSKPAPAPAAAPAAAPVVKQDPKMAVELDNYKKRTNEAEGKLGSIQNQLAAKRKTGQTTITIDELEAMLGGGNGSKAGGGNVDNNRNENLGENTSKACVIQ